MSVINLRLYRVVKTLLMMFLVTAVSPVLGEPPEPNSAPTSVLESLSIQSSVPLPPQNTNHKKEHTSLTLTDVWCADINDESTRDICWESYKSSFNYYKIGHEHRAKVFAWQHFSARIIFFVVLALVAIGIYFAWVQFRLDIKPNNGSVGTGQEKEHRVELSTSGIKVSSPVLGVIILVLSLAFFYLYLVFVYPIAEIL
ncbi:hypothetical protein [Paraglaciecola sp. L1A13]|uniref:hypothetical protein n=1 Tax=Paraglaciecola sp. L1A13 TaxID=2686359 RepID=UPI00131BF9CE|nr:hypothetical protein [Paraglaciecola sp. L1A13]